jgi:hypothetical protein
MNFFKKIPFLERSGITTYPWAFIGDKCYTITTKPLYICRIFSTSNDTFEIKWDNTILKFNIYPSSDPEKQKNGLQFIESLSNL